MKVIIYSIYSGDTDTYQGEPDQIRNQLTAAYPFLKRYNNMSLQQDLRKLSEQQALMVNLEDN